MWEREKDKKEGRERNEGGNLWSGVVEKSGSRRSTLMKAGGGESKPCPCGPQALLTKDVSGGERGWGSFEGNSNKLLGLLTTILKILEFVRTHKNLFEIV